MLRTVGFLTLPLGPTSRIVYVSKLRKTQWEKYGERAHSIRLLMLHELPHQKPQCEKHRENSHKGKRVQSTQHQVEYLIIRIKIFRWGCEESPPESGISLSLIIPIPRTHLSKDDAGNDLVNISARLSHDLVCKILTSFVFYSSCA